MQVTAAYPSALTQKGGLIYAGISGASTFTFTTLTVDHASSVLDGGMVWLSGTDTDMTIGTLVITTTSTSSSGNGGGFYLTNSGYTNMLINTGTISSSSAGVSGGFIYKQGGTTYSVDLRSLTVTSSSVTSANGGFAYLSTSTTGTLNV